MTDASTERLQAVYRVAVRTAREPLARATSTMSTRVPRSVGHRGRSAFPRDVETIFDEAAPGAWQCVQLQLAVD